MPPAELEGLLLQHPRVKDAGVVGVYDESQSTEVCYSYNSSNEIDTILTSIQSLSQQLPRAYVVLSGPSSPNIEAEIQAWVASRVARHKQLRGGVIVIDAIPKSPSGKILRRVLRDKAKGENLDRRRASKL